MLTNCDERRQVGHGWAVQVFNVQVGVTWVGTSATTVHQLVLVVLRQNRSQGFVVYLVLPALEASSISNLVDAQVIWDGLEALR
jgi:hypothetical protein